MNRGSFFVFITAVAALSALGCSNPASAVEQDTGTVYIAGYQGTAGAHYACNWEGTAVALLSTGTDSIMSTANSIFVEDDTVYAVGHYLYAGLYYLCCWEDGTKSMPFSSGTSKYANSVFRYQDKTYIAGYYDTEEDDLDTIPCYWTVENGSFTSSIYLSDQGAARANSIYVADGMIYIAGVSKEGYACLWTDSTESDSTDPVQTDLTIDVGEACGVCVADGTVYIAGSYVNYSSEGVACYWTIAPGAAPVKTNLKEGVVNAYAKSICVANGFVYTAGYYIPVHGSANSIACRWKGTTETALTDGSNTARAYAIAVHGGTAYVSGFNRDEDDRDVACYWKGTERIDLVDANSYPSSAAMGIFVTD